MLWYYACRYSVNVLILAMHCAVNYWHWRMRLKRTSK